MFGIFNMGTDVAALKDSTHSKYLSVKLTSDATYDLGVPCQCYHQQSWQDPGTAETNPEDRSHVSE